MSAEEFLPDIPDSLNMSIVFVNTDHIIEYMNSHAIEQFRKHGNLIGRSIFDCHNEKSNDKIRALFTRLQNGETEILFSETDEKRVYFTGVFDKGNQLKGYYERIEYYQTGDDDK